MELERKDEEIKIDSILKDQEMLNKEYSNFWNDVNLVVMEQFFMRNNKDLARFIPIEYNDKYHGEIRVIELYEMLETFFNKIYAIAVKLADLYSYEIKYNNTNNSSNQDSL